MPTKDDNGVGIFNASCRLISEAVRLLRRVCSGRDLGEDSLDLIGLVFALGHDAVKAVQSVGASQFRDHSIHVRGEQDEFAVGRCRHVVRWEIDTPEACLRYCVYIYMVCE